MDKKVIIVLETENGKFMPVKSAVPSLGEFSESALDKFIPEGERDNVEIHIYKFDKVKK